MRREAEEDAHASAKADLSSGKGTLKVSVAAWRFPIGVEEEHGHITLRAQQKVRHRMAMVTMQHA